MKVFSFQSGGTCFNSKWLLLKNIGSSYSGKKMGLFRHLECDHKCNSACIRFTGYFSSMKKEKIISKELLTKAMAIMLEEGLE